MKKLLLAVCVAVVMTAGTASADGGFWFGSGVGNTTAWNTFINVQNHATTAATATVIFYNIDGTLIGSTTNSLAANAQWNFSTSAVGNINSTSFDGATGNTRGSVVISPSSASGGAICCYGYTTMFNSSANAGFNFRLAY